MWPLDEHGIWGKCPGSIWLNGGGANTDVIVKNSNGCARLARTGEGRSGTFRTTAVRQSNGGAAHESFTGDNHRSRWWGGINGQSEISGIAGVTRCICCDSRQRMWTFTQRLSDLETPGAPGHDRCGSNKCGAIIDSDGGVDGPGPLQQRQGIV